MKQLSLLTVTRLEGHTRTFLRDLCALGARLAAQVVIAVDGADSSANWARFLEVVAPVTPCDLNVIAVTSKGYIESVLDAAVEACEGGHILRLDDDERCSPAMADWLARGDYRTAPHWKFATANLWTPTQLVKMGPLWPDEHTRLSTKALSGGRRHVHAGSPFGGGEVAPVLLEHHKFLVKDRTTREEIAARYDRLMAGAGTSDGMRPFTLPETCYETLTLAPLGDGTLRAWADDELVHVPIDVAPRLQASA